MTSSEIRQTFLKFFESKNHIIFPSAPMVIKNDPTLMFTNAGMNQFKDIFLGISKPKFSRVCDTQKCLRVSGKHNDLEEVGQDTYHHTMFEMLGNWSFGDYFKEEAISWAWELLTDVFKIDKNRLYVTVFGGDEAENLPPDEEALNYWKKEVASDRILFGSKKDNFWEMGESGPCGPCSEIHIDLRNEEERLEIPGDQLVNKSHPLVIEIWNLVFIQYNRLANGSLVQLPEQHVDTGMGFERLCMVLQNKQSNYDTDVFTPIIFGISRLSGVRYGDDSKSDIAMRVIADHLRAVAFAIADGQLPSNVKGGYVIRRILRRAVRYAYSFLGVREPFIYRLLPILENLMGDVFPELTRQMSLIKKVINEEENSFLRALSNGIQKFQQYVESNQGKNQVDGDFAFELYDTYGFPIDLTQLMSREIGWTVEMERFAKRLEEQKNRSRKDAETESQDWTELLDKKDTEFIGYDTLETISKIAAYRKVTLKGKDVYQFILDKTPFFAESGGQAGDSGVLKSDNETLEIISTRKEHSLIIHESNTMPIHPESLFVARVNAQSRLLTANNHSATHLLHFVLRQVLGTHVEQKGSFVGPEYLRFDFSHYQKLSSEELEEIESRVNNLVRQNIHMAEYRSIPMAEAQKMGAIALFGEKYGELVRVIKYSDSIELCGGTHVEATGQIGFFKITGESAVAAGIRRIEAITAITAEKYMNEQLQLVNQLKLIVKNPNEPLKSVQHLLDQNQELRKTVEKFEAERVLKAKEELLERAESLNGISFLAERTELGNEQVKDLLFKLRQNSDNLFIILANESEGKATLTLMISDYLVKERQWNAGTIIREIAKNIHGGGGGQVNFATAGGKNPQGIAAALAQARNFVLKS